MFDALYEGYRAAMKPATTAPTRMIAIITGEKAMRSMEVLAGALERTVSALDPYLMQFRLEGRPSDP